MRRSQVRILHGAPKLLETLDFKRLKFSVFLFFPALFPHFIFLNIDQSVIKDAEFRTALRFISSLI